MQQESGKEGTDLRQWKLDVEEGRQVWRFVPPSEGQPTQTTAEKYLLGLPLVLPPPSNVCKQCKW